MLNTLCGNVFSLPGFKNIGGVVSVNCKVYITDFTVLHFKFYTYHPLIKITQYYLPDYK